MGNRKFESYGGKLMGNYHAEIVNLSLKNKKMIKEYVILKCRKWFWGLCKIYTIIIPERDIDDAANMFQSNLSTVLNKEWYITFHTAEEVIIVFREKVFRVSGKGIIPVYQKCVDTSCAEDKQKWDEVVAYAKSLGVPDEQCDFLPEDFAKIEYW